VTASGAGTARLVGIACLLVTTIGWGINWSAMKFLLTQWPPLFARGASGLIAACLVAAVAAARGESLVVARGLVPGLALRALLNVFAWMGFSTIALRWLTAGQGAMLVYTMPVWAMLLAWPLLGRRPHAGGVAGVVLCAAGIGVLFGPQSASLGAAQWPGVVFALLAATSFAFGTVRLRPLALPPFTQLAWQLLIGCTPMLAYGLLFEHPRLSALSAGGAGAFVYMTVFAMGVCYLTWFAAVRRLSPATASMGTLLTPVVGVVTGAWTLGEALGASQWLALVLVLCGVALAVRERA
jgi:drug/metabolite transporter (DMT)-like permease